MKSPFAFFRKHRRMLTAFLTGLAMFAFIVMDQLQSQHFPAVLGVILGSALFWAVGRKSGQPLSYAVSGAVVGLVLGIVVPRMRAPAEPVETSLGSISERQIQELIQRRRIANDFLESAFRRVVPPPENEFMWPLWRRELQGYLFSVQQPATYEELREDVVLGYLLGHEADEMGITVSDEAVSDYINRVTQEQLTAEGFSEIRKEMGLSETILFDAVHEELKVRMALNLSFPALTSTPEEYWQDYRKLHVTQEVDVVEIPVEPFQAQVLEPSEGELQEFFSRYRTVYRGNAAPGEPAFAQPRKFRIAYLQADYESVESEIAAVTDEDVQAYYEENIEFYRTNPFPDSASPQGDRTGPDLSNPLEPGFSPVDDGQGSSPDEPPAGDSSDQPDDASNLDDSGSDPPGTESTDDQPGAGSDDEPEPKGAEKSGPEDSQPPAGLRNRKPVVAPRPVSRAADPASGDSTPANDGSNPPGDAADPSEGEPPSEPEPTYRPLDDELRSEIRDQILSERTRARMAEKIDAAAQYVDSLTEELYLLDADQEEAKQRKYEEITKQAEAYAQEHQLQYRQTELLSVDEFLEQSDEHPIVTATEPVVNEFAREQPITVLSTLLGTQPQMLYQPLKADDGLGNRYAYWKIKDVAPHIPTFDEPGVRQQVKLAWLRQAARPKAEARAKQVAELVRTSDQTTSEALTGQTVTGEEQSAAVTVIPTPPFSWLRVSSAPTTGLFQNPRRPEISTVAGVDSPGGEFMKVAFDDLGVGDVGVAHNWDRSAYFVVKVKSRTPATSADLEAFRQAFIREPITSGGSGLFGGLTPYEYLGMQKQQQVFARWFQKLQAKYEVRWNQPVDAES